MKRVFDVVVAGTVLIAFSPIMILLALIIRVRLGAPVLFRQERPGLGGEPFEMIKFRSMRDALDSSGNPLPDSERMTGLGRILRASSLDELPGLWNVLRGEMSLVGPRPLLMQYLSRYTPEQARRHEVRPGITGWAQVHGRNAVDWEERFKLDVWYVDHQSLGLDMKILWMTVARVWQREGVNAEGHVTMPEFKGSSSDE